MGECFFWYRPTRVVTDKRPLNDCVCVCVCVFIAVEVSRVRGCVIVTNTDWTTMLAGRSTYSPIQTPFCLPSTVFWMRDLVVVYSQVTGVNDIISRPHHCRVGSAQTASAPVIKCHAQFTRQDGPVCVVSGGVN